MEKTVKVSGEFIQLNQLLKLENIAASGGEAKAMIESGRVLVRASGTEPLVRVMIEGRNKEQIERLADQISEVVRERLI